MAVPFLQHVSSKKEITMANFVPYIVQEYVTKIKSCVQEAETIPVAKSHLSVSLYPKSCGVMMLVIGVQDSALPIAKIGNKFVLLYKILVTDAQQNPYANQKLRTLMEFIAHKHLLLMAVLFHARLWTV